MIASMIGRIARGMGSNSGRPPAAFPPIVLASCCLSFGLAWGLSSPVRAADYAAGPALAAPEGGVACSIGQPFWVPTGPTAETLPWPSVYYGHFSGGRPYVDAFGRTIVDWRDEHVCFPTSAQCRAWVKASYRTHHQPEGYRGCLLLR
ncbi:conserved hypothetical protein [Methylocella tundrae]|uniref:Uncharacterized protein n=1 Tax=Methylocella tundrae TaxID=227605 RepID=A0A8B6M319_METTU|nr:conserved hypothetical protein [Methylocella tundrae]VTZ49427.1 conserved hypothetical protein [Methylocella tundrae]